MDPFESVWQKNLQNRFQARVESCLTENSSHLILSSADDCGVRLNGGRPGARLSPKAMLNVFKKLTASPSLQKHGLEHQLLTTRYQLSDFENSQLAAHQEMLLVLGQRKREKILHLGGGHDHIFPYLLALQADPQIKERGLFIVNIDAHLDTRTDEVYSSGTPFRQWDQHSEIPFHLVQVGIHPFANPKENYQPLKKGRMDILHGAHHQDLALKLESLRELGPCPNSQVLISLDADALSSSCMSAVSAVNHQGLELNQVLEMMDWAFERCHRRIMGIYEYNPIFDDLSQKGARALAVLMDRLFQGSK